LKLYSSYPPFIPALLGDSVFHQPKFDAAHVEGISCVAETVWLLQNDGDSENVDQARERWANYAQQFATLTSYVENLNVSSTIDISRFNELTDDTVRAFETMSVHAPLETRLSGLLSEAKEFVRLASTADVDELRAFIESCVHLFRGACGVRHVDFIAYKP